MGWATHFPGPLIPLGYIRVLLHRVKIALKNSSDLKSSTSRFIPCLSGFVGTSSIFRRIRNLSARKSRIAQIYGVERVCEGRNVNVEVEIDHRVPPLRGFNLLVLGTLTLFEIQSRYPLLKTILVWVNHRPFLRFFERCRNVRQTYTVPGFSGISGHFGGICRIWRIPRILLGFCRFHRK